MTQRKYRVEHVSSFRYEELAQSSLMLLRLRPRDDGRQRVRKFSLKIDPFAATTEFEDPFGNRCHLFNVHRQHRSTEVHTRVQVESAEDRDLPERLGADAWEALAGASHAWGEFFLPDLGWVGIDPTNDTVADHRFIAVAVGRDYADACPTRGTVLGGGRIDAGCQGDRGVGGRNRAGLEPPQGVAESAYGGADSAGVQSPLRSMNQ